MDENGLKKDGNYGRNPGTPNKWKFLAKRIILKRGGSWKFSTEQLRNEFIAFVDYYAEQRAVFKQKSRQRKGKDGAQAEAERIECTTPMTEVAFCVWLGVDRSWMTNTIRELERQQEEDEDFTPESAERLEFLHQIQAFFNSQLLEGAILGEYTPNIVASLLNLKNQVDVTSDKKPVSAPVINIVPETKSREELHGDVDKAI